MLGKVDTLLCVEYSVHCSSNIRETSDYLKRSYVSNLPFILEC